jgi:hypothetical protein
LVKELQSLALNVELVESDILTDKSDGTDDLDQTDGVDVATRESNQTH